MCCQLGLIPMNIDKVLGFLVSCDIYYIKCTQLLPMYFAYCLFSCEVDFAFCIPCKHLCFDPSSMSSIVESRPIFSKTALVYIIY